MNPVIHYQSVAVDLTHSECLKSAKRVLQRDAFSKNLIIVGYGVYSGEMSWMWPPNTGYVWYKGIKRRWRKKRDSIVSELKWGWW